MEDSLQQPPRAPAAVRTYVVGEDAGRLANAASYLGLEKHNVERKPLQPVRDAVSKLFHDTTLTAARMHSVGAIGSDERVDTSGTLHYVSVRRRQRPMMKTYGSLHDLFEKQEQIAVVPMEVAEEEEEEVIVEDIVEGGSLQAAIFGIVKGTVGPAILYLPHGFQTSGYAVAIPAMMFATFMYIYNAHLLLACWKVESDRNHQVAARIEQVRAFLEPSATNDDLAASSSSSFTPTLLTYPELARRAFGSKYSFPVDFGISSMQFGVCLTYLIFVPANLYECTLALFGVAVPKSFFLLIMVLIEIPLSWITDIRKLTPTNVLATTLIAYGLIAVLIMAVVQSLLLDQEGERAYRQNLNSLPALTDSWFIFIGTSFFMMEGSITLLVPLQEAVFRPDDKAKFPAINQTVTTWIVVFYIFFSFICVAGFGKGLQTALTASLKGSLASSVQLAYAVAVILTFPLQAFPAMEVTCKAVLGDQRTTKLKNAEGMDYSTKRQILATFVTCLLGLIALVAIDYLGNVVSILGSLFGIPLALVFPPLMYNTLVKDASNDTRLMNHGVVVIGFAAMGAASFATIVTWNQGAEDG